jgi:DNA-binding response OmpR family regulator
MARILIVEDNPDLLLILDQLLSADHEVLTARRGEEGVALVREERPDAVILDVQLPTMDGIEAGLWMKRETQPMPVPILVLTGMASAGDAEAILASGCCDMYLAKPAPLARIRESVEQLLSRERSLT